MTDRFLGREYAPSGVWRDEQKTIAQTLADFMTIGSGTGYETFTIGNMAIYSGRVAIGSAAQYELEFPEGLFASTPTVVATPASAAEVTLTAVIENPANDSVLITILDEADTIVSGAVHVIAIGLAS